MGTTVKSLRKRTASHLTNCTPGTTSLEVVVATVAFNFSRTTTIAWVSQEVPPLPHFLLLRRLHLQRLLHRLKRGFRATATSMAKPNPAPLALPLLLQTKSLQTISTPGTRSLGLVEPIATPNSSQDTTIARALQYRRRFRPEALATAIITPRRWMGTIVSSLRRIKVSRRTSYILGTPCWVLGERTVGLSFSKGIGTASGLMAEGFCCEQSWFLSRFHLPCQHGKKRWQARANLGYRISITVRRSWKTV